MDALTGAGVDPARIYTDKLLGTSTRQERPDLRHCWTTQGRVTQSSLLALTAWAATLLR
jgi:hypothetical protein